MKHKRVVTCHSSSGSQLPASGTFLIPLGPLGWMMHPIHHHNQATTGMIQKSERAFFKTKAPGMAYRESNKNEY